VGGGGAVALHFVFFVFVVVAIEAEEFPVAAVGGVVVMVVVFVVDGEFLESFTFEFAAAACAEMREEFECAFAVAFFAFALFAAHVGHHAFALSGGDLAGF
jgi:hypothetical protein